MIDIGSFTYYELETLKDLVQIKIESKYRMKERHPSITINKDRERKEIDELMLLQVKITQYMNTLEAPSMSQRFMDGKKIYK